MSLYFFHLRDGRDTLLDPEGRELVSLELVRRTALDDARTLIAADALDGLIDFNFHLDVEDSLGTIIHSVQFEDAVKVIRKANR